MEVIHEISGAIIAITLVMTAVFVPVTFMTGPVGVFYRQFAITMAASIVLSGVVALTLTPVLCAMILKPLRDPKEKRGLLGRILYSFGIFLRLFDRGVEKVTGGYAAVLRRFVPRRLLTLIVIAGFSTGIYVVNIGLPPGFIPNEDQGVLYGIIQTPPGSTLEYTNAKSHELQKIAKEVEGVTSVTSLAGYEVLTEGRGSNAGTCIINLKPWSERKLTSRQLIAELEEKCQEMTNVKLEFFEPPAVPGFGAAGGFAMRLLDKIELGRLQAARRSDQHLHGRLVQTQGAEEPVHVLCQQLPAVRAGHRQRRRHAEGRVDRKGDGQPPNPHRQHLRARLRPLRPVLQGLRPGRAEFRRYPADLGNLFVKNDSGEMVPYSAFMHVKKKQGLNEITRFNVYPSAAIQGAPAAGYSSGQAIDAIKEVAAKTLPRGYGIGWEGISYDEASKGNQATYIFMIVVFFVYLVLVGQYESFLLPLAVIISLPVGIFGSFLLLTVMGLSNDVYAQISMVMLVGQLGKNAILIVEFAVQRRRDGLSLVEAGVEGGRSRFRPILMTSFAFVAGLIPLVFATGAGALGNRTIGTASAGGMLIGTVVGVMVIPGLYYLFARISDGRKLLGDEVDEPLSELLEHEPSHA